MVLYSNENSEKIGEAMELAIHGKQMDVGAALRAHVQEKIEDISSKYFNHTTYASVTFSRDGHGHQDTRAHITIQLGKNIHVTADGVEKDPYVAFDAAATKAGKQLRRYKRRLRDHHGRLERAPESDFTKAQYNIIAPEKEETEEATKGQAPVIVAEMATNIQTMSVSEAVMRLDLSGNPALLFRNGSHGGLNMVYRRQDGNIGWVDPESRNALKVGGKKSAAKKPSNVTKLKPKNKAKPKAKPKTAAKSKAKPKKKAR